MESKSQQQIKDKENMVEKENPLMNKSLQSWNQKSSIFNLFVCWKISLLASRKFLDLKKRVVSLFSKFKWVYIQKYTNPRASWTSFWLKITNFRTFPAPNTARDTNSKCPCCCPCCILPKSVENHLFHMTRTLTWPCHCACRVQFAL